MQRALQHLDRAQEIIEKERSRRFGVLVFKTISDDSTKGLPFDVRQITLRIGKLNKDGTPRKERITPMNTVWFKRSVQRDLSAIGYSNLNLHFFSVQQTNESQTTLTIDFWVHHLEDNQISAAHENKHEELQRMLSLLKNPSDSARVRIAQIVQRSLEKSSKFLNMLKINSTQVRLYVENTRNMVHSTHVHERLRLLNKAALNDPSDQELKDVMEELNVSQRLDDDPLDGAMNALKNW